MQRELVIAVDEEVYEGLHRHAGPEGVGRLIEDLVRTLLVPTEDLEAGYQAMARDEERERAATEWANSLLGDGAQ